ncbi:unnamed protein product, partial [Callosobruchus maculatus]
PTPRSKSHTPYPKPALPFIVTCLENSEFLITIFNLDPCSSNYNNF